jgi:hypothetical protein
VPKSVVPFEEQVAREFNRLIEEHARILSNQMGPPPSTDGRGTERLSEADELMLWNQEHPPEQWAGLDPAGNPTEYLRARWPHRERLIKHGRPKLREQIDYAQHMQKRAQKVAEQEAAAQPPIEQAPLSTAAAEPVMPASTTTMLQPEPAPAPAPASVGGGY